jgi:hypothetical protein
MRSFIALATVLLASSAAFAQTTTVTGFRPACGSGGDPILIEGTFPAGSTPIVKVAGVDAAVLRASANRILARVDPLTPQVPGATVEVNGIGAPGTFAVLGPDAPVVHRLSAQTATEGQVVLAFGRRLGQGTTVRVGTVDATNVRANGRVLAFTVPAGVAGPVPVTLANAGGATSGSCSPILTVVARGAPAITGFDPASQRPGGRLTIQGTDLGPIGLHRITWDDGAGQAIDVRGVSNGYDRVFTNVPFQARAGVTYTVTFTASAGPPPVTAVAMYTVAAAATPVIDLLSPDAGPERTRFRIEGSSFFQRGARPTITLGTVGIPVTGSYRDRATGKENLLTFVPAGTANGVYGVVVTVGGIASSLKDFTVGARPLAVASLRPDTVGPRGPTPIEIRGSGFGNPGSGPIAVTFTDTGGTARDGLIIFRNDNLLVVVPPGGRRNPLPAGVYEVRVAVGTGAGAQSVVAGTYTVP